jgi:hypothetical protein
MACTVSYFVLVNGSPVGLIILSRGIRKGDPISPYLFLICVEALSSLLHHAELTRVISRVPTSKRGPKLRSLFFANDSLIFCKANKVEWRRVVQILGTYEVGFGKKLNLQKTSMFFIRNTNMDGRQEILNLSGFTEATRYETYLDLLVLAGRSRIQSFNGINDRVWKRLNN